MPYYFFSRTSPPPAFGKFLVSGVVVAATENDAIAQLNSALRKGNNRDDAQDFVFQNLATASRANADGLIAITTAEEED